MKDKNKTNEKYQPKVSEFKEVDKQLRESENLKSSIFNAVPHAVIGLKEREIIFANRME